MFNSRSAKIAFCRRVGGLLLLALLLGGYGCAKKIAVGVTPSKPATGNGIVATALSQIGTKYTAGGESPATGFDCSGLVSWVYSRHGVTVPRRTQEQASVGKNIPRSQMQPGDIVVFTISRRLGMHTGIYAGQGKFIHSPGSGKRVREESMSVPYWNSRFTAARRVL